MTKKSSTVGKVVKRSEGKQKPKAVTKSKTTKSLPKTGGTRQTVHRREPQSLAEQLAQREAELQIINSIQQGLASKLETQAIYDLVGEKIREIFKNQAQTVFFTFYDPATD